jgi:hypothetical protein
LRADWIKLISAAARLPLRSDPAKSKFLRPSAHGRIWFSHQLLSMGMDSEWTDRAYKYHRNPIF